MDITTKVRLEKHGNRGAQVYLDVSADGVKCQSVLICGSSEPHHVLDMEELVAGKIALTEVQDRWRRR